MGRVLTSAAGLAALVVLIVVCFGSVLFHGEQFGYRDAAHFYYPLYLRVQQEWDARRIPLWEPEENGGIPLIGNPTAAVLYPGKLVFLVRPYAWAARLYVIGHILLAFMGTIVLARSLGISGIGAILAALAYAFGAPVLFQYANVIYLVGAAWVPWGFHAADRWIRRNDRWALAELAVVLAMQTLGGDPQAAYLVVLSAACYAVGLAWRRTATGSPNLKRLAGGSAIACVCWSLAVLTVVRALRPTGDAAPVRNEASWPSWPLSSATLWAVGLGCAIITVFWVGRQRSIIQASRPLLLGVAGSSVLAICLAAPHLLPTIEYSRGSFRAADRSPVEIYPFSLPAYRLAELVCPNVFGTPYPANRHWLLLLEQGRTHEYWSPSLYLGGLTVVLLAASVAGRGGPSWRIWLMGVAAVSVIASLGRYGSPLWLARSFPAGAAAFGAHDPPFGGPFRPDKLPLDGDGGFYWILSKALPGFGTFRFPSKFLTFAALAAAILAGEGWDRVAARPSKRTAAMAVGIVLVSLLALGWTALSGQSIAAAWSRIGGLNSYLGPFEARGAVNELLRALGHGSVSIALAAGFAWKAHRSPRLAGIVAVAALAGDLAVANARLVWTIPQAEFDRVPEAVRQIAAAEQADPAPGPFRVHRMPQWYPYDWLQHAGPERLRRVVGWERDTLQPLFALPEHIEYTMTKGALELYDYLWFFRPQLIPLDNPRVVSLLGVEPGRPVLYYPRRGFDLWTTRYFLVPARADGWTDENRAYASFLEDVDVIYPDLKQFRGPEGKARMAAWREQDDWQLLKSKTAYPRAWIVHEAHLQKPIVGMAEADRNMPMRLLLYQSDAFWHNPGLPVLDTRRTALVETDDRRGLAAFLPGGPPDASEIVRVTHYDPQRVELEATLTQRGLVILADVYYSGWKLAIDGVPSNILRTNRLMRGAAVEAGVHRLVYTYDPASFRIGVGMAAGGVVALGLLAAWAARGSVHIPNGRPPSGE
jgi:hypothetical protein